MNRRKLTDAQVLAIRSSFDKQDALAAEYGVSHATISQVQRGASYKSSPWPELPMGHYCRCPRCRADRAAQARGAQS